MNHLYQELSRVLELNVTSVRAAEELEMLVARRMSKSLVELNLPLTFAAGKLSEIVGPIRVSTGVNLADLKNIVDIIVVEVERVVMRLQKTQEEILRSEKFAAI